MYFFNCTCLCLSGYKPYIIKKTKFESDYQIIGSAQNESFHARKMKRTCFNPCRGLRGFRRSRPAALPSIGYRGFAVAPMTLRASLRGTAMQPSVANASNRCNDAAQRCKRISSLRFLPRCRGAHRAPADILPTFDFSIPIPPSSREGDRPAGGGRSSRAPLGLWDYGEISNLPRSKVATGLLPFAWDAPPR